MSSSDTFPKTNESFFLNKEEVRSFSQDGYLLLSSFFTTKQIKSCLDKVRKYIDETVPLIPSEETFYEVKNDHTTLKQLQRMHTHEPWFDICLLYTSPSPRD